MSLKCQLTENLLITEVTSGANTVYCLDEGINKGLHNFGRRMKRGWEVDTTGSGKCAVMGFGVNNHYPIKS
jgi:hypothetical protein